MTSQHDKMQTDYLWVRDHTAADSGLAARYYFDNLNKY